MNARAWQAWAALGVAAVALVAGLIASRGLSPEDELEHFGREQRALRAKQRAEAEAALERLELEQQKRAAELEVQRADLRSDSLSSVLVSVGADTLSIGGVEMTPDEAEQAFREAYDRDPQTQIVLQAERDVPHARVVDLMERAKGVGLTRLAIGTTAP